eukprot:NODE_2561_length_2189_cov_6.439379.p1 GENE.NODE_2561_length_2189_cov_6.439379~~NODE_2561_length_2189_cov_6.439379.p1  ORF type:complete len:350 (+),score=83.96 NODE_2561_length_2189_cov_6.439379:811-1860(+)
MVFFRAGQYISINLESYRMGSERVKHWIQVLIHEMHVESLDWGPILDDIVTYLETLGSFVTGKIFNKLLQAGVTLIFLLYMLWSPINIEGSSVAKEVVRTTGRYIKVKSIISGITGGLVVVTLWATGLDLPVAFGLLAFIANFLPGIGSSVATVLPCILALIDYRKTPAQVLLAFILQTIVHFCIVFLVEPVFFSMSSEIHSVIVILGIYVFGKVWGVAGMLISVPLLAILRLWLKSVRHATKAEDQDSIVFLENILAGRWMRPGHQSEDLELEGRLYTSNSFAENPEGPEGGSSHNELPNKEEKRFWTHPWESSYGQQMQKFYQTYRLTVDILWLVFLGVLLFLMPLV